MATSLRRILKRGALVVAALVLLAGLAIALVLTHLDHPSVKRRIIAQAASATGLVLDYRALSLTGLHGLHVEDLIIESPAEVRASAEAFVRLEQLDLEWAPGDLPKLRSVSARGLTVTYVQDDSGASSLSGLKRAPSAAPPLARSRQPADLLQGAPPFEQLQLTNVTVRTLTTKDGAVREQLTVKGLALSALAEPDGPTWKAKVSLGAPAAPLELDVAHDTAQANVKLLLDLSLSARDATLSTKLTSTQQTFAPEYTLDELADAKLLARFEPEQHRISIDVQPSRLAGVASLEGALVLPDDAAVPPTLTTATVNGKLGPLLAVLPKGLVPVTLDDGTLQLDARDVTLSALPKLGPKGTLTLKAEATSPRFHDDGAGHLALAVSATPSTEGISATATLSVTKLEASGVKATEGTLTLTGEHLMPAPASPLYVAGDVALSLTAGAASTELGALKAAVTKLGLEVKTTLPQRAPFAVKADLPIEGLRLTDALGKRFIDAPARLRLELTEALPVLDAPLRSQAKVNVTLDVGTVHATLEATKSEAEVAYAYALSAPDLSVVAPLLPAETAKRAPLKALSLKVDSTGNLTKLGSPSPQLEHRTTFLMPRAEWDTFGARDVAITVHSKGDALVHEGDVDLKLQQLQSGEKELGTQHLVATVQADRRKLELRASVASREGTKLSLETATSYDAARHAVKCHAKAVLDDAERSGPLLAALGAPAALDATKLKATFTLDGALTGVVENVSQTGDVRIAKEPLVSGGFDGTAALDVNGFRWQHEGQGAVVPSLKWRAELHATGARRSVRSKLDLERLVLLLGEKRVIATQLAQDLTATVEGDFEHGALTLTQTLNVATLEQRPALPVPLKNLSLLLEGSRQSGGFIRLSEVLLKSPETRSELSAKGTVDLSDDRRQLALRGTFKQDLAALDLPELFEGRGALELGFGIASPDLTVFRTRSKLRFKDVHVKLPDGAAEVEGLEGEVAVNESVELGDDGLKLTREIDANPYSMLRYADQHPLLSQNSFITAKKISTPYGVVTPFAGNLAIEQNVLSLSQLELGLRGGRVTGQCTLDLQGRDSTLEAHVRATGVQSSRGEPFDGNAAIVVSARERSINGRAEILRIGNQHLRDLLDIQDPQRLDPAINRVRYGLTLGYPEHLRLVFDHGFASMHISFGGAARVLKIDDVRGIPVGPLVSRALTNLSLPE